MRLFDAMILACLVSGCAGANTPVALSGAGEWKVGQRADRVADQPIQSAVLISRSRNVLAGRTDYMPQEVSLQLMCFDGDPVVRFYFSHEIGANRNSRLNYRFDNRPAGRPNARILQDYQTLMIEDRKDVVAFVNELRDAKRLDITVSSLNKGNTTAEFNVEGAALAIESSFKTCPLPAAAPVAAAGRSAKRNP